MNVKIRVDYEKEIDRIKKEAVKIANGSVQERTKFATEALRSVTPVDTGYAASRWQYEMKTINGETVGDITNDTPYLIYLNKGSSKQAPPFFIEQTLLTIGELSAPVKFE